MLLFLESIGTSELLFILVAALVLFGPRKLPELARSLGKSMNDFKRASEDFKQTWQREVEVERVENRTEVAQAMLPDEDAAANSIANSATTIAPPLVTSFDAQSELVVRPPVGGEVLARGSLNEANNPFASSGDSLHNPTPAPNTAGNNGVANVASRQDSASKRDWL